MGGQKYYGWGQKNYGRHQFFTLEKHDSWVVMRGANTMPPIISPPVIFLPPPHKAPQPVHEFETVVEVPHLGKHGFL